MPEIKRTFPVEGMHCMHCVKNVRTVLEEDVDGVKQAVVNLEKGQVELTYDDAVTDLSSARRALEESGYKLVVSSD